MLPTNHKSPRPLQPRPTGLGKILRTLFSATRFTALAILVLSSTVFTAAVCRAQNQQPQSAAEAARRARAKKQEAQKSAKHVYTEEDLKRKNILTPEDRAKIEAKRNECAQKNNCSPAPAENSPAAVEANSETPATSLGEVARKYRRQKELEAQKQKELQALKPKQSEPFHLPFSNPALASPVLPDRPVIQLPTVPALRPENHSAMTRRDPFSRGRVGPNAGAPESQRSGISRPEVSAPKVSAPKVAAPKIWRGVVRGSVDAENRATILATPEEEVSRKTLPDFSAVIRPIVPSHSKLFARPVPPVFFVRRTAPSSLGLPIELKILAEPMQPIVPVESVRPAQPAAPLAVVSPVQPRSVPATPAASAKTVNVQPGDSLWKLAQQNLGSGSRWPELVAANSWISDPARIRAGARVALPAATAAPRTAPGNTHNPAQTVKVRKGDTLWALAKANLGHSSAWPCLAAANPGLANPDRIFAGQELHLPAVCAGETPSTVSR
jgi:LysM repeat protein